MTYPELKQALSVFGYAPDDKLTVRQIKKRYRELVKSAHPDLQNVSDVEIKRINQAASLLLEYINSYSFSFTEKEFYEQNGDERIRMQFYETPNWGVG